MRFVLQNRIIESVLFLWGQALCPILAFFITENPAAVVFAFKDINPGFMKHDNINFAGAVLVREVDITELL